MSSAPGRGFAALCVASMLVPPGCAAAESSRRAWTVQDSVAVRYFVTNDLAPPGWVRYPSADDRPFRFSPDRRHFFFLSFHGDLPNDRTTYELSVFSVNDVRRALATGPAPGFGALPPRNQVVMHSRYPGGYMAAAIYRPRWESNTSIHFAGADEKRSRRAYRFDIETGQLTALGGLQYELPDAGGSTYAIRGGSIVFQTLETHRKATLSRYPMLPIAANELDELFEPEEQTIAYHASYRGAPAHEVLKADIGYGLFGPWISPDEQWAVIVCPPKGAAVPALWDGYQIAAMKRLRFMLVNLETGLTQPMLQAPAGPWLAFNQTPDDAFGTPFDAFWSSDSQHVLLVNAMLPLREEAADRRQTSYLLDYDIETAQLAVVDEFPTRDGYRLSRLAWVEEGKRLRATFTEAKERPAEARVYSFERNRWRARMAPSPEPTTQPEELPNDLALSLRQSANDLPVVFASSGVREVALTGADPALNGVWRAPVEVVRWKDSEGAPVESLLMLPRDFRSAKPAPLVIQISDPINPADAFRPDGEPGTSFAAQALAAQGFAVLQTEAAMKDEKKMFTPQEGPAEVSRLDTAVEMMRQRGIADGSPVGLIGFSRSGYSVYYILTHPGRARVGAAVVFDSVTNSYGEYVMQAGRGSMSMAHYGRQYGDGTFWQNKQAWLDAPSFNVEKVTAPTLFAATRGGAFSALETVGAFRYTGRPFEYLLFPEGDHILQTPRQREAAMQASVDWMNFWLRQKTPEDPKRAARWGALRKGP